MKQADLISRNALLNSICDRCNREFDESPCEPSECLFYQEIVNATEVEVTPAQIAKVETNIFDKVETFENCTVQILTNTATGEVSVGWRRNDSEG